MNYNVRGKGSVTLTQREFISQGGEGKVFGKGSTVYKIYEDPKRKMIPEAKIKALSDLTDPKILNPIDIVVDKNNQPVGFTMDWVKNAVTLCKVFTNTFRDQNDIDTHTIIELVEDLKETFHFIHSKGCLIVDANELNFLVDEKTFKTAYCIDVDSYQTANYPATAIMPSIRDWTANDSFSAETDWYSFAILSFQLFTGIHPYKGKHPGYGRGDIGSRCKAHISVLNQDVTIPRNVRDFGCIPSNYMSWYNDLFEAGIRSAPPYDGGSSVAIKTKYIIISSTDNFDIKELGQFDDPIVSSRSIFGYTIIGTKGHLYLGKNDFKVSAGVDVMYAPKSLVPIMVKIQDGKLKVKGAKDPNLSGSHFTIAGNVLYMKSGDKLLEMHIFEHRDGSISLATKNSWMIMPNSSEVFQGVIYQSILGKAYLAIPIPAEGSLINLHVPELEGYRVIDAKYEDGVCVVICHQGHTYSRMVIRFLANDADAYDIRITTDVELSAANFAVLESGVVALITDDGTFELFSRGPASSTIKTISDPAIDSDMVLCRDGGRLQFFKGDRLYSIRMK